MASDRDRWPRKRFGQHFLRDSKTINRIVESIPFENCEAVVEIGPGRGALTMPISEHCSRLHLIEIDRDLSRLLEERRFNNAVVTVHQEDALHFDYPRLARKLGSKLVMVGNLPYNIATPLLFQLVSQLEAIQEMVFMVKREIAARLTAKPGGRNYGRLTVMIGRSCVAKQLFEVGPEAFHPIPKVHSSVVRFLPRRVPLGPVVRPNLFESVVRDAFAQRRKTLRNALRHYQAETVFKRLEIDPQLRAERLSIEQFAQLAAAFAD